MIEDGPRKSILACKSGLLLGTDIAKLVRKDGVRQPAVEPSSIEVRNCEQEAAAPLTNPRRLVNTMLRISFLDFGWYGLQSLRENSISKLSPAEPALSLSNGDG